MFEDAQKEIMAENEIMDIDPPPPSNKMAKQNIYSVMVILFCPYFISCNGIFCLFYNFSYRKNASWRWIT